mmetsp:Transcript_24780/g.30470  ORF Transcript_24780/g.30470 Transcript_24780/m.30470 type:complete len:109 (-) Transcript_24780:270-596(-)
MASEDLKPYQKYPTPTRGFGDRVFYETLLKQKPSSVMAQEWCLFYGVLSNEDAEKLGKIVMKRKGKPIKSTSSSPKKKRKVKVKSEIDDVIDAGLSAGGDEGLGTTAM